VVGNYWWWPVFGMALRDQGVDLVSWNAEGAKEAGDVGVGVRRRIDG
jgi:hypothetical protein